MAVNSAVPLSTRDDLSLAYTPGVAGCARPSPPTSAWCTSTPGSGTPSPLSPTARRCSAWATSGPRAALPVMEGKARAVQAVRQRRRGTDLPGHPGQRGDHRDGQGAGPVVRRDQPGGHQPRRAASRSSGGSTRRSTSRSSTTTSTVPRSWCSRRCATRPPSWTASSSDLRVVISGAGAAGVAVTKMLIAGGVKPRLDRRVDSRGAIHVGRDRPDRHEARAGRS